MSTATTAPAESSESHDPHDHGHPTDAQYVKIALFLGVVTALEVGTYFWKDATTGQLLAGLMPMMVIKFATVAGYFMHLKYDTPILRRVFTFGLVLAVVVYAILGFAFEYWSDDYLKYLR